MSEINNEVKKTYNQKAKDALMKISSKTVAELYLDAIKKQMDVLDDNDLNFIGVKNAITKQFNTQLVQYVLCNTICEKDAERFNEAQNNKRMKFKDIQIIVDLLDE